MFKKLLSCLAKVILINAKLFTLMSSNESIIILYLFFNKVQETIKCYPPINRLKLISKQLTIYFK